MALLGSVGMTTHHWTAAIKYSPNNASINFTSNALGVSETINTIYIFVLLACGQIYRVWQWFSVTHGWRSRMVQSGRQSYKRCSLHITLETDKSFRHPLYNIHNYLDSNLWETNRRTVFCLYFILELFQFQTFYLFQKNIIIIRMNQRIYHLPLMLSSDYICSKFNAELKWSQLLAKAHMNCSSMHLKCSFKVWTDDSVKVLKRLSASASYSIFFKRPPLPYPSH